MFWDEFTVSPIRAQLHRAASLVKNNTIFRKIDIFSQGKKYKFSAPSTAVPPNTF